MEVPAETVCDSRTVDFHNAFAGDAHGIFDQHRSPLVEQPLNTVIIVLHRAKVHTPARKIELNPQIIGICLAVELPDEGKGRTFRRNTKLFAELIVFRNCRIVDDPGRFQSVAGTAVFFQQLIN